MLKNNVLYVLGILPRFPIICKKKKPRINSSCKAVLTPIATVYKKDAIKPLFFV